MKASNVIRHYPRLRYKASDGNVYYLREVYPLVLGVSEDLQNEQEEVFALDTGGEMDRCDFFVAKIVDGVLYRQDIASKEFLAYARNITLDGDRAV